MLRSKVLGFATLDRQAIERRDSLVHKTFQTRNTRNTRNNTQLAKRWDCE